MFALYASERHWLAFARPELPLADPVVGTITWEAFYAIAPTADCSVVAVQPADATVAYGRLLTFMVEYPFAPVVVVADRGIPPQLRLMCEVIRPPLKRRRIWPAIQRASTRSLLAEAAVRAEESQHHPAILRTAVAAACRSDPPLHSVAVLADIVGCHRRTLWRHWHETSPAGAATSLLDLLDWILMLRLCLIRPGPSPWDMVAARVGVHRQTLARIARRTTALPLRELTPDIAPRIRRAFRQTILDPFTAQPFAAGSQLSPLRVDEGSLHVRRIDPPRSDV
jgi:hypothetical protein